MERITKRNAQQYTRNENLPFDVSSKTDTTSFQKENGEIVNHSLYITYAPTQKPQIAISVVIPGGTLVQKVQLLLQQIY